MKVFAKVTHPDNGYSHDSELAHSLIAVAPFGAESFHEVKKISIGRSSTKVQLVGDKYHYNSVNFTFYVMEDNAPVEYDIFKNEQMAGCIEHDYIMLSR